MQNAHRKANETIQEILEIGQSVRSLEHMNAAMAEDVTPFRESQPAPPADEEGAILRAEPANGSEQQ